MLRRSTRVLLEVVVGLAAAIVLVVGVTVWRLSEGPLRIDALTPYLEQALAGDQGGSVEIGETVLIWADWSRTLDLRARHVSLRDASGFTIATLPAVSVTLSLRALFQGVIAPTEIEVIGARVTLIRWSDGGFDFGLGQAGAQTAQPAEEADLSAVLPGLLSELGSEPSPARPLSFLKTARILDGALTIIDRKLNTVWHAPTATMEVRRDPLGLAGGMRLTLEAGKQTAEVQATFSHDKLDGTSTVKVRFSDLRFEALASLVPFLAPAQGLRIPVDGSLAAGLDRDGGIRSLAFELSGGAGSLSLPGWLAEPVPVSALSLRGRLDSAAQRLEVDGATLSLGPERQGENGAGPVLTLKGSASLHDGDLGIEVEAKASDIAAGALSRYWPTPVAANARKWVVRNITAGRIEKAWANASLRLPGGDPSAVSLEAISGGYRFRDLTVHYKRPMPPVTGVSGSAVFDKTHMTVTSEGGHQGDLEVAQAAVEILGFDKPDQAIDIDVQVDGPLRSMLELLDHESLRLVSALGIDPAHAAGQASVRAGFRMPLVRDLTYDRMEITARAKLTKASLRNAVLRRTVANGDLTLSLDKRGMTVTGPVELAGVPIDLDWRESFTAGDGPHSVFAMKVPSLGTADRASLGLDTAPYLDGPVSASLRVSLFPDHSGTLETAMKLDRASLSIPFLNWEKPPTAPGELRAVLDIADDEISGLETFEIQAGSLSARGRGRLLENGAVRLELEDFAWDKSRLSDVTLALDGGRVDVRVGGGVFDAAPFMGGGGEPAADGGDRALPVFKFRAPRLEAVTFAEGRRLEQVAVALDRDAQGWRLMSVDARLPRALWSKTGEGEEAQGQRKPVGRRSGEVEDESTDRATDPAPAEQAEKPSARQRAFHLDYHAVEAGGYTLEVASGDMGALLRALDLRDTVRGGHLRISGKSAGPIPTHPLTARIEADDYVMVEAPILARMLSVASLTGLMDTLQGKGIHFDRLTSDFTLTDGVAETELLRAYGSAIGITAKGDIDFNTSQVDLEGTLVPAYTVNRILGAIPVLGPILTGGEGEGLLGFVYDMEGELDDPKVSINPLSALAPGFLRGLFGGTDGEAATVYPEGRGR